MTLWHRHQWQETSRQFSRSSITFDGPVEAGAGRGVELVREVAFGITVVELRCAGCGDVKGVRYVGDCGITPKQRAVQS